MDDSFEIYDLKVEVTATDRPMVCSHRVGDYFLVEGENLVFPEGARFSLYALGAILPVLAAKQRVKDPQRLDEHRRGHRVPGPQLRGAVPHHPDQEAPPAARGVHGRSLHGEE